MIPKPKKLWKNFFLWFFWQQNINWHTTYSPILFHLVWLSTHFSVAMCFITECCLDLLEVLCNMNSIYSVLGFPNAQYNSGFWKIWPQGFRKETVNVLCEPVVLNSLAEQDNSFLFRFLTLPLAEFLVMSTSNPHIVKTRITKIL